MGGHACQTRQDKSGVVLNLLLSLPTGIAWIHNPVQLLAALPDIFNLGPSKHSSPVTAHASLCTVVRTCWLQEMHDMGAHARLLLLAWSQLPPLLCLVLAADSHAPCAVWCAAGVARLRKRAGTGDKPGIQVGFSEACGGD